MSANKAAQRQAQILTQLRQHGGVRASELARTLQVSPATIHRDLDALAGDGHLLKVHGGAVATDLHTVSGRPWDHRRRSTPAMPCDDRLLVHYTDGSDAVHNYRGTWTLPPATTACEPRYDPLLDEWVLIASSPQPSAEPPGADHCPLCPSRPGSPTEVPVPQYQVAVFDNRFPPLGGPGAGRCEVLSFSPSHHASFTDLTPSQVHTVLTAVIDRTAELSRLAGVEQVYCFESTAGQAAAHAAHPHSHIYALPVLAPHTQQMINSVARHRGATGRNLFEDILTTARTDGRRIVATAEHWTAFVPSAARRPYEVHLYPNRRVPDLAALSDAEKTEFAWLYLDLLRRFNRLFPTPAPYVSAWHQAPVRTGRECFALHLELFTTHRPGSPPTDLVGAEAGMGLLVNNIAPEQAAVRLREAR